MTQTIPIAPAPLAPSVRTMDVAIRPDGLSEQWQTSCKSCSLRRLCLSSTLNESDLALFGELAQVKRRVGRNMSLFRAGSPLQAFFVIFSGALKTRIISRDGKEKVTGFYFPGDIVGLDAVSAGQHPHDGTALEDTTVCVIPFDELQQMSYTMPTLQQRLLRAVSADISRDQGLVLIMGGMTAEQRLAAFLLSLSQRYQRLGFAPDVFRLRMTRQDIASYLGLTLETVCRLLARFQREGLIAFRHREMHLLCKNRLHELLGSW